MKLKRIHKPRNFVAKHNTHRAVTQPDKKNDYDRSDHDSAEDWDEWLLEELERNYRYNNGEIK